MTPEFSRILRCLLIFPPLAAVFVGLPGGLARMLFLRFALSPHILPLWVDAGVPGAVFGFALPMFVCQFGGMIIGFCIGIFVFSRFMHKEHLLYWLTEGKQMRGYTEFVQIVVALAYR